MRAVAIPRRRLQPPAVGTLKSDENSGSHASIQTGIASRIQKSQTQFIGFGTKERICVHWNDQDARRTSLA
jgi:hypothetical protein